MKTCPECGRTFDSRHSCKSNTAYCSDRCLRSARAAAEAAGKSFSGRSSAISQALINSAKGSNIGKMKLIIPTIVILIIIGLIGVAVDGIRNAFSSVKIDVVSASCETQEEFVSILKDALSEVSATVLEGEEFTTYSRQARDAVKERNKYSTFKDSVYLVRLPDSVNVYIWFKTEDQTAAYVYKTK